MTREERALKNLKQMCSDGRYLGSGSYVPLEVLEDFEVLIKALEQEPIFSRILEKTYNDFCNCEGGEGWLKIDDKEYSTDAGYALEGVNIFMEVFKRRLAKSEEYVNFADVLIPIMDEAESEEG